MSPQRGQFPPSRHTTIYEWVKIHSASFSHPPRPFPLGRGASRPLSSGVQATRRFACFSCPLPVSVGSFQRGQGFALPSGVARVLAFGCGPRQPPLRPLTPFPLQNPTPGGNRIRDLVAHVRQGRLQGRSELFALLPTLSPGLVSKNAVNADFGPFFAVAYLLQNTWQ